MQLRSGALPRRLLDFCRMAVATKEDAAFSLKNPDAGARARCAAAAATPHRVPRARPQRCWAPPTRRQRSTSFWRGSIVYVRSAARAPSAAGALTRDAQLLADYPALPDPPADLSPAAQQRRRLIAAYLDTEKSILRGAVAAAEKRKAEPVAAR